ncbi:MAG TPA: HEAT repeat domain-containing protein [Planctomycetota bacterium]|jgi:HEAT repeat protein
MKSEVLAHLSAFNDPREGVRLFAARKLASYGASVAPTLIQLLKEEHGFTRDCASVALHTMGEAAIPFLLDAMKADDRVIRWQAAAVLSSMGESARKAIDSDPKLSPATHEEVKL